MRAPDAACRVCGRRGQVHGPSAALHPGLRVKYVVDPRPGAAAPLCERFGAAATTLEQALADPEIGAVLVCSSTDQHLAHALAAVDAGKAVFCEKPIDLDLQKVLQARARFDGARFLLGFNRRFDPAFRALKPRLAARATGRPDTLPPVHPPPPPP